MRTLERLAQTDALTGLAIRRHWLEQVKAELTAAASGAVVICDLDRFKGVNDVYGHEAGDEALIQFSRLLPAHGFAGRLGGDEFAIWIGGDVAVAEDAAALLIEAVQRTFDERYRLGLSLGIAPAPECGETPIDLLRAADHALYEAKAAGRGRARVAFKHSVTERNIRQRR